MEFSGWIGVVPVGGFLNTAFRGMDHIKRRRTAILVIAGYVLAGFLLEIAHHDAIALRLDADPFLAVHNCGDKEIHVPLDQKHQCLACSQSTLRVSTEANQLLSITTPLVCLACVQAYREQPIRTDILYSGKRGPPVYSL